MDSRQRYVLGDSAMKKMAHSHVLLVGFGGLGVEIGKFNLMEKTVIGHFSLLEEGYFVSTYDKIA